MWLSVTVHASACSFYVWVSVLAGQWQQPWEFMAGIDGRQLTVIKYPGVVVALMLASSSVCQPSKAGEWRVGHF